MSNPRLERFRASAHLMRCPLCHLALEAKGRGVACPSGHCFDISKKGTVNFIPQQKPLEGYDADFFEHRSMVLAAGFYDHVVSALSELLDSFPNARRILDVGCGEGFYAKALQGEGREVFAFDISKEAVQIASKGSHETRFFVADLSNIPMRDGTVDFVVNVFTPANYGEFARILSKDGLLAKVVPASRHLCELREKFKGQLQHGEYSNELVVEHFKERFELISRTSVRRTVEASPREVADFVRMTPLLFHVDDDLASSCRLDRITVDAEILLGKPLPSHREGRP